MLTVIFGAGASYDSVSLAPAEDDFRVSHNLSLRPPLAKDLFSIRFNDFVAKVPEAAPVIARMRREGAQGGDVEQLLGQLQDEAASYPAREMHMNAVRFYLQYLISACSTDWLRQSAGITNYISLVDELLRWQGKSGEPMLFITFNYDTLLEAALEHVIPDWTPTIPGLMDRSDVMSSSLFSEQVVSTL